MTRPLDLKKQMKKKKLVANLMPHSWPVSSTSYGIDYQSGRNLKTVVRSQGLPLAN